MAADVLRDADLLLLRLRAIHARIRDAVIDACERGQQDLDALAQVAGDAAGDTVFAIDRVSEDILVDQLFTDIAQRWPLLLVAEGLGETGRQVLPAGATPDIVVIVDPIDGTRGLMFQKRPGWILTGVAPYRGDGTSLADLTLALQTEIPLVKQHLSDTLWTVDGFTASGERRNRLTGAVTPLVTRPSGATSIEHGFGGLARFFPGPRAILAEIDDALVERIAGGLPPGRAVSFEDQYIATGGQLYELMMGHDRWCADLRPLVWRSRQVRGLCCHPYDLCSLPVARAAGVIVTAADGGPLRAPLDTDTDVAWIGYANDAIRRRVEPVLQSLLRERGLLGP
jgi:hypothetical protein